MFSFLEQFSQDWTSTHSNIYRRVTSRIAQINTRWNARNSFHCEPKSYLSMDAIQMIHPIDDGNLYVDPYILTRQQYIHSLAIHCGTSHLYFKNAKNAPVLTLMFCWISKKGGESSWRRWLMCIYVMLVVVCSIDYYCTSTESAAYPWNISQNTSSDDTLKHEKCLSFCVEIGSQRSWRSHQTPHLWK